MRRREAALAHEVGHLIAARHEMSYVNGTKWRDIMGYKGDCGGCQRRCGVVEPDRARQRLAGRHQ